LQKKNKNLVNQFNVNLGENITTKIKKAFSLEENININELPMMWLIGELEPHIDENIDDNSNSNKNNFDNTYIIYLSDNEGSLIIKDKEYSMESGTGYIFGKEIHGSKKTSMIPRLCIGSFGIDNKSNKICRAGFRKKMIPRKGFGGRMITQKLEPFTLQKNESNIKLTKIIIIIAIISIIFYYFWKLYSRKKR
jgi:hypothetical protein